MSGARPDDARPGAAAASGAPSSSAGGAESMDAVIASIRQIIRGDDQPPLAIGGAELAVGAGLPTARSADGVLRLDPSMLVQDAGGPSAAGAPPTAGAPVQRSSLAEASPAATPPAPPIPASSSRPEPAAHTEPSLATASSPPSVAQPEPAGASSVGALLQLAGRGVPQGGGLTVEAMVRDALRPILVTWLDTHLPAMVERIVRVEVERIINRG